MLEYGSSDFLREKADKCRLMAAQLIDERAAESLRKLADEYENAADAERERHGFCWKPPE